MRRAGDDPPDFIPPMLPRLVDAPPAADDWLHEIKHDGYRLHARVVKGKPQLLTRRGNDWTGKYPGVARAIASLPADNAYIDGEVGVVDPETSVTSFRLMQAQRAGGEGFTYFAFDLLHVDGGSLIKTPLAERKAALAELLAGHTGFALHHEEGIIGSGPAVFQAAAQLGVEGIVSKRAGGIYVPGDERLWLKAKCLNREEFVILGWSPGERSRGELGSILLGYFTPDGRLWYAGRVGTGFTQQEMARLLAKLKPLEIDRMLLAETPPKTSHFGRPLELKKVRWVRPELVAEVTFVSWTADKVLRHVSYQGLREDKPPEDVVRERPA
jgi:DNA ligase D-like protein (predicted ligase)